LVRFINEVNASVVVLFEMPKSMTFFSAEGWMLHQGLRDASSLNGFWFSGLPCYDAIADWK